MAVQLISPGPSGSLTLNHEALRESLEQYGDKPIKVVTICGEFRSGKSALLNTWRDNQEIFKVGHTTKSETLGVWMDVIEEKEQLLVVLDTEGWGNSESDRLDVWLPLAMMMVSSELVVNAKAPITDVLLKNLASLLWLCNHQAQHVQPPFWNVPAIRVVLRDFDVDLEDDQDPDEYFEGIIAGNGISQRILQLYLHKWSCYCLPRPHLKPKLLGTLNKKGSRIKPVEEFLEEASTIWNEIARSPFTRKIKTSGWIDMLSKVMENIEAMRLCDPRGSETHMNVTERDMLELAKACFTQSLEHWDIIDPHRNLKYRGWRCPPHGMDKLYICYRGSLAEAKKVLLDTNEAEFLRFTENLYRILSKDIVEMLQADLSLINSASTDIQAKEQLLARRHEENAKAYHSNPCIQRFYLRQLLTALEKTLKGGLPKEKLETEIRNNEESFNQMAGSAQSKTLYNLPKERHTVVLPKSYQELLTSTNKNATKIARDSTVLELITQHKNWWEKRYHSLQLLRRLREVSHPKEENTSQVTSKNLAAGGMAVATFGLAVPGALPVALGVGAVLGAASLLKVGIDELSARSLAVDASLALDKDAQAFNSLEGLFQPLFLDARVEPKLNFHSIKAFVRQMASPPTDRPQLPLVAVTLDEYIDKMAQEMEFYARAVIPLTYHWMKYRVESMLQDISD